MANDGRDAAREERANRILDAALALILRWGYNKTTIDDISRQADVAKGTIYLHWKTREDLFDALLRRERLEVAQDIQRRIMADPEGWTLRGIVRHSALATMQRPLIKALFMSNRDVLGRLANSEMSGAAYAERLEGFKAYLMLLREHGLVRTDLSLQEEVFIWSATLAGFFFAEPLMPEELKLSDEKSAELMAETVHRALETDRAVAPEEYRKIANIFNQYLRQSAENAAAEDAAAANAAAAGE